MTSISQERTKLAGIDPDRLRRREEAGFRYGSYDEPRTVDEPATEQYVHITITNPDNYPSDDRHAQAVESIGISRFPSVGISYNRLFMQSGRAYEGQPIGRRGAHTVNDDQRSTCATTGCPSRDLSVGRPSVAWNLNYSARAYVICQNVDDPVTAVQLDQMTRKIVADRLAGFVTAGARIHGHRCVSTKSCPGDRMWAFMDDLEKKVAFYLENGLEEIDVELSDSVGNLTRPDTGAIVNPTVGECLRSAAYVYYYLAGKKLLSEPYNNRGHTVGVALETAKDGVEALRIASALQADDEDALRAAIADAAQAQTNQINATFADFRSLLEQHDSGELAADDVVRRIGELLTAAAPTEPTPVSP